MKSSQRIFLVGPMGAGKSTIGRLLADQLHYPFVDSDHEIEHRTGANIPWIFDKEGEEGFRLREEQAIESLTLRECIVLATGGGVVMRSGNRQHLQERGLVIYLETPVLVQLERTARDRNRPLLRQGDPEATLTRLLTLRDPLYREIADHIVPTVGCTAREVAGRILALLHA